MLKLPLHKTASILRTQGKRWTSFRIERRCRRWRSTILLHTSAATRKKFVVSDDPNTVNFDPDTGKPEPLKSTYVKVRPQLVWVPEKPEKFSKKSTPYVPPNDGVLKSLQMQKGVLLFKRSPEGKGMITSEDRINEIALSSEPVEYIAEIPTKPLPKRNPMIRTLDSRRSSPEVLESKEEKKQVKGTSTEELLQENANCPVNPGVQNEEVLQANESQGTMPQGNAQDVSHQAGPKEMEKAELIEGQDNQQPDQELVSTQSTSNQQNTVAAGKSIAYVPPTDRVSKSLQMQKAALHFKRLSAGKGMMPWEDRMKEIELSNELVEYIAEIPTIPLPKRNSMIRTLDSRRSSSEVGETKVEMLQGNAYRSVNPGFQNVEVLRAHESLGTTPQGNAQAVSHQASPKEMEKAELMQGQGNQLPAQELVPSQSTSNQQNRLDAEVASVTKSEHQVISGRSNEECDGNQQSVSTTLRETPLSDGGEVPQVLVDNLPRDEVTSPKKLDAEILDKLLREENALPLSEPKKIKLIRISKKASSTMEKKTTLGDKKTMTVSLVNKVLQSGNASQNQGRSSVLKQTQASSLIGMQARNASQDQDHSAKITSKSSERPNKVVDSSKEDAERTENTPDNSIIVLEKKNDLIKDSGLKEDSKEQFKGTRWPSFRIERRNRRWKSTNLLHTSAATRKKMFVNDDPNTVNFDPDTGKPKPVKSAYVKVRPQLVWVPQKVDKFSKKSIPYIPPGSSKSLQMQNAVLHFKRLPEGKGKISWEDRVHEIELSSDPIEYIAEIPTKSLPKRNPMIQTLDSRRSSSEVGETKKEEGHVKRTSTLEILQGNASRSVNPGFQNEEVRANESRGTIPQGNAQAVSHQASPKEMEKAELMQGQGNQLPAQELVPSQTTSNQKNRLDAEVASVTKSGQQVISGRSIVESVGNQQSVSTTLRETSLSGSGETHQVLVDNLPKNEQSKKLDAEILEKQSRSQDNAVPLSEPNKMNLILISEESSSSTTEKNTTFGDLKTKTASLVNKVFQSGNASQNQGRSSVVKQTQASSLIGMQARSASQDQGHSASITSKSSEGPNKVVDNSKEDAGRTENMPGNSTNLTGGKKDLTKDSGLKEDSKEKLKVSEQGSTAQPNTVKQPVKEKIPKDKTTDKEPAEKRVLKDEVMPPNTHSSGVSEVSMKDRKDPPKEKVKEKVKEKNLAYPVSTEQKSTVNPKDLPKDVKPLADSTPKPTKEKIETKEPVVDAANKEPVHQPQKDVETRAAGSVETYTEDSPFSLLAEHEQEEMFFKGKSETSKDKNKAEEKIESTKLERSQEKMDADAEISQSIARLGEMTKTFYKLLDNAKNAESAKKNSTALKENKDNSKITDPSKESGKLEPKLQSEITNEPAKKDSKALEKSKEASKVAGPPNESGSLDSKLSPVIKKKDSDSPVTEKVDSTKRPTIESEIKEGKLSKDPTQNNQSRSFHSANDNTSGNQSNNSGRPKEIGKLSDPPIIRDELRKLEEPPRKKIEPSSGKTDELKKTDQPVKAAETVKEERRQVETKPGEQGQVSVAKETSKEVRIKEEEEQRLLEEKRKWHTEVLAAKKKIREIEAVKAELMSKIKEEERRVRAEESKRQAALRAIEKAEEKKLREIESERKRAEKAIQKYEETLVKEEEAISKAWKQLQLKTEAQKIKDEENHRKALERTANQIQIERQKEADVMKKTRLLAKLHKNTPHVKEPVVDTKKSARQLRKEEKKRLKKEAKEKKEAEKRAWQAAAEEAEKITNEPVKTEKEEFTEGAYPPEIKSSSIWKKPSTSAELPAKMNAERIIKQAEEAMELRGFKTTESNVWKETEEARDLESWMDKEDAPPAPHEWDIEKDRPLRDRILGLVKKPKGSGKKAADKSSETRPK